jgi:hypothetical protein
MMFGRKTTAIGLVQALLLTIITAGQAFSQVDPPEESNPSVILTLEEQEWLTEHKVIRVAPDPDSY